MANDEPAMATIRILAEDDVPAVAALFTRVPEYRWSSQPASESYFREMLFNNPWCDLQVPSWVAEENGRITGFYLPVEQAFSPLSRPTTLIIEERRP